MDQIGMAIEAYNEAAAECHNANAPVQCQKRTAARDKSIKARLAEVGLAGWRDVMAKVVASDFLSGRSPRGRGHENFRVDIAWIAKAEIFARVIEGKYDGNLSRKGSAQDNFKTLGLWAKTGGFDGK